MLTLVFEICSWPSVWLTEHVQTPALSIMGASLQPVLSDFASLWGPKAHIWVSHSRCARCGFSLLQQVWTFLFKSPFSEFSCTTLWHFFSNACLELKVEYQVIIYLCVLFCHISPKWECKPLKTGGPPFTKRTVFQELGPEEMSQCTFVSLLK